MTLPIESPWNFSPFLIFSWSTCIPHISPHSEINDCRSLESHDIVVDIRVDVKITR